MCLPGFLRGHLTPSACHQHLLPRVEANRPRLEVERCGSQRSNPKIAAYRRFSSDNKVSLRTKSTDENSPDKTETRCARRPLIHIFGLIGWRLLRLRFAVLRVGLVRVIIGVVVG